MSFRSYTQASSPGERLAYRLISGVVSVQYGSGSGFFSGQSQATRVSGVLSHGDGRRGRVVMAQPASGGSNDVESTAAGSGGCALFRFRTAFREGSRAQGS